MVLNEKNNSTIWYHVTRKDRLRSILKEGLKCFSKPNDGNPRFPWIYLSASPPVYSVTDIDVLDGEPVLLEVDLRDAREEDVSLPFADNCHWEIRSFVDILPEYIKVLHQQIVFSE